MRCAVCSRHVLTLFLREAAGINLPKTASPLRRVFRLSKNNRCFSTTTTQALKPSRGQRNDLSASSNVYETDDAYIPFDHLSVAHVTITDNTEIPWILPPPRPLESPQDVTWTENAWLSRQSTAGFEPEVVLQDRNEDGRRDAKDIGPDKGGDDSIPKVDTGKISREITPESAAAVKMTKESRHQTLKTSKNSIRKALRYSEAKEALPCNPEILGTAKGTEHEGIGLKKLAPRAHQKASAQALRTPKTIIPARRTRQQRLQSWREQRQRERVPSRGKIGSRFEELQEAPLLEDAMLGRSTEHSDSSPVDKLNQSKAVKRFRTAPKLANTHRIDTTLSANPKPSITKEDWQIQKAALDAKFGEAGWTPRKKLSPDALEGIRALRAQYPAQFTTPVLADSFKVSPEAIRRILKSKWQPNTEEEEGRRARWEKRGERIWAKLAEGNVHPPKRWRELGIGAGGPRRGRPEWLAKIRKRDGEEGERPKIAGRGPGRDHPMESLARRIL